MAAFLSVPDPRARSFGKSGDASRRFVDKRSDFMGLLALWKHFHRHGKGCGRSKLEAYCRRHQVSLARIREWQEVHRQLVQVASDFGFATAPSGASYNQIHKALLTGLLRNIGWRSEAGEYQGVRESRFSLFPTTALANGRVRWVIAGELIETSRLFAHIVARIRPEWIEELARGQVRRDCFGAFWGQRREEVVAYEGVTLYGLPIIHRRKLRFSLVDALGARELFVQGALVDGDSRLQAEFLTHNRRLVTTVLGLEQKLRRPGSLLDETRISECYARFLPEDVLDGNSFRRWYGDGSGDYSDFELTIKSVLRNDAAPIDEALFPDSLTVAGLVLPCHYRFAPGEADDGIRIDVPLCALATLGSGVFDWIVPGRLAEKVQHCLRGLPKEYRRQLGATAAVTEVFIARQMCADQPLLAVLADFVRETTGVAIVAEIWETITLPDHLRVLVRIHDANRATVDQGRDADAMFKSLRVRGIGAFRHLPWPLPSQHGLTAWSFDTLPERVDCKVGQGFMTGFPGLVDEGNSVSLRIFHDRDSARVANRSGIRRLMKLHCTSAIDVLQRRAFRGASTFLGYLGLPVQPPGRRRDWEGNNADRARDHLFADLVERAIIEQLPDPDSVRDAEAFSQCVEALASELDNLTDHGARTALSILEKFHTVNDLLDRHQRKLSVQSRVDMREQLHYLVHDRFVATTPLVCLHSIPRFLDGLARRIPDALANASRDAGRCERVRRFWERYLAIAQVDGDRGPVMPDLEAYRWMVEEFRLAVFARELVSTTPASESRLAAQWIKVCGEHPFLSTGTV